MRANNIYVVGFTYSTNFPTVNALFPTSNGGEEAWVAKIASSGNFTPSTPRTWEALNPIARRQSASMERATPMW